MYISNQAQTYILSDCFGCARTQSILHTVRVMIIMQYKLMTANSSVRGPTPADT